MNPPPIPVYLAHRPVHQGLVVPHVSLVVDGRVRFGGVKGTLAVECIVRYLCQICGRRLPSPAVFLVPKSRLAELVSREPGMCPPCAAYSMRACPMVAGQMSRYIGGGHTAGEPCDVAGCGCEGWVDTGGADVGAPAEPWFAVWVRSYQIGVQQPGPVTVGNVSGAKLGPPIKVRPVPQPAPPAADVCSTGGEA